MKLLFVTILLTFLLAAPSALRAQTTSRLADSSRPDDSYDILFLGDTSHGENYQLSRAAKGKENILETQGYAYSLQKLHALLKDHDEIVANLETPVLRPQSEPAFPYSEKDYIHWTDPDQALPALMQAGIKNFSLANNHTVDYGPEGLLETLKHLEAAGATGFGAGRDEQSASQPLLLNLPPGYAVSRIAVIGCFEYRKTYDHRYRFYADETSPGARRMDLQSLITQIGELRQAFPDLLVIVFPHWGKNYRWAEDDQKQLARDLVSSGADLIVGHGGHTMADVEQIDHSLVFHSIGNFLFNSDGRYAKENMHPYSLMLSLRIPAKESSKSIEVRGYPILSNNLMTNFQPRLLDASEFKDFQEQVASRVEGATFIAQGKEDRERFVRFELPVGP